MVEILYSTALVAIDCGACGVPHALSETKYKKCLNDGEWWYCPNGHHLHFISDKLTQMQRQLEIERQRKAQLEAELAMVKADRRHTAIELKKTSTRLKNVKKRVVNGVCPCCNRTFQNLAAHMQTQHNKVIP